MRYNTRARTGLGDTTTDTTATSPSWIDQLAQGFAQYKLAQNQLSTQQQITALQLQRAQAGLPPLNIDPSTLGVPSVSVGLSAGTQQLVTYGIFGLLGLLALKLVFK